MSVRVSDRTLSKVEFINNASLLFKHTLHFSDKFPKSLRFTISVPLTNNSREILEKVQKANSIIPKTKQDFINRRANLIEALGIVDSMDLILSHIEKDYLDIVSEYAFLHWGELLDKERILLKGIIKSDEEIYNDLL